MSNYQVQITGKSAASGDYAATFPIIKNVASEDIAKEKALKRTKLLDASVYQVLKLSNKKTIF